MLVVRQHANTTAAAIFYDASAAFSRFSYDPISAFAYDINSAANTDLSRDPVAGQDGVKTVKIPAKSPNCNAHAERFVKTIKYECLNHFVFFGERHLRYVIREFGEQLIEGQSVSANDNGTTDRIVRRSRLGYLLNYYHRKAA